MFDTGADDRARDDAKMLLDGWTPFARVSRRLLADLLDRSEIVHLPDEEDDATAPDRPGKEFEQDASDLFGFVVVHGAVEVSGDSPSSGSFGVGMHHRSDFDAIGPKLTFRARKARLGAAEDDHMPHPLGARLALIKASTVTPELAWSLQMHKLPASENGGASGSGSASSAARAENRQRANRNGKLGNIRDLCRPELIWCDTDFEPRTHLAPLVHLLAGTIARDLHEPVAVVCLGPGTTSTSVLLDPEFGSGTLSLSLNQVPLHTPPTHKPFEKKTLLTLVSPSDEPKPRSSKQNLGMPSLTALAYGNKKRSHVLVFDPNRAGLRRGALDSSVTFDRIVHLTTDVPRAVPAHLQKLLDPGVFDPGDPAPYYTSYIASVPVARDVRRRGGRQKSFKARAIRFSEYIKRSQRYQYLDRLQRDSCVVPVDLDGVLAAWARWSAEASSTPFIQGADHGISRESLSRWGRAVTNRRIGFALSGGGACAYRAGPLLRSIEKAGVPIDVFAGLSGGALVGAFYCHSGLPGFDKLVALGPFIQATEGIAPFTTCLLEKVVDFKLGGARVEDLEMRFAAVAVALPPDEPPMTDVVVNGTLGEAARVSGTLPPMFAPTIKNGMRFTDGGAGTIVPSQVARDFGADIVLACNAIPGPQRSNPVCSPLRPLFRILFWQRMVDSFAWYAYFWRQASQRFLREADVQFEFPPEDISMLESNEFICARSIVANAEQMSPKLDQVADQLRKAWEKLGDRPSLQHLLKHAELMQARSAAQVRRGNRAASVSASPRSGKNKALKKKIAEKKTAKKKIAKKKIAKRRRPKERT